MTNEDTYPNKDRASGYTDDGKPVGEGLVNVVTGIVTAAQTKWVLASSEITARLEETSTQVSNAAKTQEQRFDYMLGEIKALYAKEDTRHQVYDQALEKTETDTKQALASVLLHLDEITSYVQQSVTIGREAHTTGKEALAIAKKNAAQMVTLKKAVTVLERGQAASKKQWKEVLDLLADSKTDRADLRERIDALSLIVDEHNRVTAQHELLVHEVAELKERLDKLERGV